MITHELHPSDQHHHQHETQQKKDLLAEIRGLMTIASTLPGWAPVYNTLAIAALRAEALMPKEKRTT